MTKETPRFSAHGGRLITWKGRAAPVAPAMLLDGQLSNTGRIEVAASASGSGTGGLSVYAYGIEGSTLGVDAIVSNSGSILVTATADGVSTDNVVKAYAVGIELDDAGLIVATAMATGTGTNLEATAHRIGTEDVGSTGTVSNTGTILVTADADDPENVYDIPRLVTLDDADGPKLFRDGDVIATVEPVNLAFSGQIAAEMANMGGRTVAALLAGAPSTVTTGLQNAEGADAAPSGTRGTVFFEGDLVSRELDDAAGRELGFDISGHTASTATDFTALELGIGYSVEAGAGMLSIGASGIVGDNGLSGHDISTRYHFVS
jgi:hypothetical protein